MGLRQASAFFQPYFKEKIEPVLNKQTIVLPNAAILVKNVSENMFFQLQILLIQTNKCICYSVKLIMWMMNTNHMFIVHIFMHNKRTIFMPTKTLLKEQVDRLNQDKEVYIMQVCMFEK